MVTNWLNTKYYLKRTWQLLNEITMRKIKSYKWPNEFYCSEHTDGVE